MRPKHYIERTAPEVRLGVDALEDVRAGFSASLALVARACGGGAGTLHFVPAKSALVVAASGRGGRPCCRRRVHPARNEAAPPSADHRDEQG